MQLPNLIYVSVDGQKGEEYFNASAVLDNLVEVKPNTIATYKLVKKDKYKLKVTLA